MLLRLRWPSHAQRDGERRGADQCMRVGYRSMGPHWQRPGYAMSNGTRNRSAARVAAALILIYVAATLAGVLAATT